MHVFSVRSCLLLVGVGFLAPIWLRAGSADGALAGGISNGYSVNASSDRSLTPVAAAAPLTPTGAANARTSREMLVLLAQTIQTTGMMMVRERPTLVVKNNGRQLLVKTGDSIPVMFEGAEHPLVVSAITRTTYTVEWGGEQVTRPIRGDK